MEQKTITFLAQIKTGNRVGVPIEAMKGLNLQQGDILLFEAKKIEG